MIGTSNSIDPQLGKVGNISCAALDICNGIAGNTSSSTLEDKR